MERQDSRKSKARKFLNMLYEGFFKSNDSVHRIALGFGLGVFLGVFPGTGPAAALFLAFFLRLNKASALAGSLLTNTWVSVVIFFMAIKTGSTLLGIDWHKVNNGLNVGISKFQWVELFKISSLKILLPVLLGYVVIGLCMGLFAYLIAFIAIKALKR